MLSTSLLAKTYQSQEEQQQGRYEAFIGADRKKRTGEVIGTAKSGACLRPCQEEAEYQKHFPGKLLVTYESNNLSTDAAALIEQHV